MDRFWHPLQDAGTAPPTAEGIATWEKENKTLPADYVRFMLKYDGGFLNPDMFRLNAIDPEDWLDDVDDPTQLDHLYSWQTFVKKNGFKGEVWSDTHVAIGEDISSSSILLDLAGDAPGSLIFWYRNNDGWDEDDGPVPIGYLAPTFTDFVTNALTANPDGPDSRWSTFLKRGTAQPLDF